jgi:hypothetical protein
MLKLVIWAVFLTIVETAPATPWQAPSSAAPTTDQVPKHANPDKPARARTLPSLVPSTIPKENQGKTKGIANSDTDSVRITDLPL